MHILPHLHIVYIGCYCTHADKVENSTFFWLKINKMAKKSLMRHKTGGSIQLSLLKWQA